jgi:hypothetical protein
VESGEWRVERGERREERGVKCTVTVIHPFLLGGRYRVLAELGHSPFKTVGF